jgi:8-oxo-dGTP pyrophosphatase MutT (NUDIX family)
MTAVEPRAAASLLVLRDGSEGLEVLFVRRVEQLRFMGGAWVFPGGALSATDGDSATDLAWKQAAVRETHEEAGIALGDAEQLVPFSRWITPELVPMRFDTRFYLAAAPDGAEPTPDESEVDRAEWWTPAKAIDLFVTDRAELHFPTIKQVENLVEFETVGDAISAQHGRTIEPILPRVATSDDGFEILLPGDPGYDELG